MAKPPHGTWVVDDVDQTTLERLAAAHTADPLAVELGVDLVADPNRLGTSAWSCRAPQW